jgi:hypothetical protein
VATPACHNQTITFACAAFVNMLYTYILLFAMGKLIPFRKMNVAYVLAGWNHKLNNFGGNCRADNVRLFRPRSCFDKTEFRTVIIGDFWWLICYKFGVLQNSAKWKCSIQYLNKAAQWWNLKSRLSNYFIIR